MLSFKIIKNIFLKEDTEPTIHSIYLSQLKIDKRMMLLYIYKNKSNNYIPSYTLLDDIYYILTYQVYVFPKWTIGFNLKKIKLPQLTFFAFQNPQQINSYPLSAIIWPPAIKYSKSIIKILKKHYKIVKLVKISLVNSEVLPFIYNLYQGDLKCDKSQLPQKKRAIEKYPLVFIYIKFLIPKLDLNRDRISNSAIKIKNIIRNKVKPYINNYIYDIIFHVSDNLTHSINMEKSVKRQNKNTQLINVN